jgi:integrase
MADSEVSRIKVEPGVWKRSTRTGEILEITWRDAEGRQRRQKVAGGILQARRQLRERQGERDRGERHQANARLRFADAAERWLESRQDAKRAETIKQNRQMVERHLRPRYGNRRMDAIAADDAAGLVRSMRSHGYAEQTITHAVSTLGAIFKFAARRLGGPQQNPVGELLRDERPHVEPSRHVIYAGDQLAETIAASHEPYRTLFSLAVATGARQSELLGIRWTDLAGGAVSIRGQVDRKGAYVDTTKNVRGVRDVPLPAQWMAMLDRFKAERALAGFNVADDAYVFSTRSGRPLNQRNVLRELRKAQGRARTLDGRQTFAGGRGPDFHAFRHQFASVMIAAGMGAEDVADHLGDTVKTVHETYRQAIADAKRERARLDLIAAEFEGIIPG